LELGAQGLATLTLDRPRARNALSPRMIAEFVDAVDALARWDGVAVILCGAGGTFCAGSDLHFVRQALDRPELAEGMCALMQDATQRLAALPLLSVAVVQGAAFGGGAELATAADLRVAGPNARVRFVHSRLGLSPGWGGGARLTRLVGPRHALRTLALSPVIEGAHGVEMGLLDAVADDPMAHARALLAPALSAPAESVRAAKRVVLAGQAPLDLSAERARFVELWGGPAMRAALGQVPQGR
jgi:ethylmalonyl-CoA/methylmalonyl-CoA decarboxylase